MEENLLEFRTIPGYEGLYSVNQSNQVLSHINNIILKYGIGHKGHLHVKLSDINKIRKGFNISVLVAMAWNLPKEPNHKVVKHLDNIPSHNYVSNLKWDTQSQNVKDAFNDGLSSNREKHYSSKLTESDVLYIINSGLSTTDLLKIYDVTRSTINRVKSKKTWK